VSGGRPFLDYPVSGSEAHFLREKSPWNFPPKGGFPVGRQSFPREFSFPEEEGPLAREKRRLSEKV